MGNCSAPQYKKNGVNYLNWPTTANIIHLDGRLQEFGQPIKARSILSQNPNFFLCNLESMYIGSQVPRLPEDEELQLGQIYFLMPLSKSQSPITLQELCSLAIKANSALSFGTSSRNGTVTEAGFSFRRGEMVRKLVFAIEKVEMADKDIDLWRPWKEALI